MSKLSLVTIDQKNDILYSPTKHVSDYSAEKIQSMIKEMGPIMYDHNGVGLAATQVGQGVRVAVITPDPDHYEKAKGGKREVLTLINPKIIHHSVTTATTDEGCLSVPKVFGTVKRWHGVTVKYFDENGQEKTIKARGLLARVLQHEIDHLDGILFIQRATKLFEVTD